MKTSFQFIALGVGTCLTVGNMAVNYTQPAIAKPQSDHRLVAKVSATTGPKVMGSIGAKKVVGSSKIKQPKVTNSKLPLVIPTLDLKIASSSVLPAETLKFPKGFFSGSILKSSSLPQRLSKSANLPVQSFSVAQSYSFPSSGFEQAKVKKPGFGKQRIDPIVAAKSPSPKPLGVMDKPLLSAQKKPSAPKPIAIPVPAPGAVPPASSNTDQKPSTAPPALDTKPIQQPPKAPAPVDIPGSAPNSPAPPKPVNVSPANANPANLNSPPPEGVQPNPGLPNPSAPNPSDTKPVEFKPGAALNLLDHAPNPLLRPTKPEEVKTEGTRRITLREAQELAERNNQDLEIAKLQVEKGRATLREAKAVNFPSLSLNSSLTRTGNGFIESSQSSNALLQQLQRSSSGSTGSSNGNTTVFGSGLQLDYSLIDFGARSTIGVTSRQLKSAELQLEQTRETVRLQVAGDYYDLQDSDEQVRINEAAVRNAQVNLRDSQAQEKAGLGTRFDSLRAEVNLANAQQLLTNARSTQSVRRRQLVRRLNLAESASIAAVDPVQPAGKWERSLEDTIVQAYQNRAELEDLLVQRDISATQIKTARAANLPTLGFQATYQYQRVGAENAGTRRDGTQSSDSYNLGLRANWSLFDGGRVSAQIQQRQRDKEIAEARFVQSRNQVRFEVEQAYSQLQANFLNIATTKRAVDQAKEALRLAVLRFQAGVGTQTDRINAETELTRAEGNSISAIVNYNRALAQLKRAVSNVN